MTRSNVRFAQRVVRHPRVCSLAMLAALAFAPPAASADTARTRNIAAGVTAQRMLDALLATNGVPGMGAAVWRDGGVVWAGSAGMRDIGAGLPVRRDTLFRLASVSKLITATAAAKLAQDGQLDLDAPVGSMLPWLPQDWAPVSVRQLAAHIAGAPHYSAADASRADIHYATARDAVGIFSGRALLSRPGTRYAYSSWGYTLIGAVIEARSQQHFLDYVARHITAGLDVRADGNAPAGRVSQLYDIQSAAAQALARDDFSYTWPGGGLAATPEAIARFGGRMLQHRIVSASTWRAMLQPALLADRQPAREQSYEVGLGWRVQRDQDGARIAHHAGATAGARSALVLWPEQSVAASVLSNASWVSSIDATAIMLAAPFKPAPAGLLAAACPTAAVNYSGTLGEQRFSGVASFRLEDGRCVGEMHSNPSLDAFYAGATAWPGRKLRILALAADGRLARAALVTPTGLYDLRADGDGRWAAQLGARNRLDLIFVPAPRR